MFTLYFVIHMHSHTPLSAATHTSNVKLDLILQQVISFRQFGRRGKFGAYVLVERVCICVYVHVSMGVHAWKVEICHRKAKGGRAKYTTATHMCMQSPTLQHSVQANLARKEHLRVEKTFKLVWYVSTLLFFLTYTPRDIREICFCSCNCESHFVPVDCRLHVPDNSHSVLGVGH